MLSGVCGAKHPDGGDRRGVGSAECGVGSAEWGVRSGDDSEDLSVMGLLVDVKE